ncbi:MAG TPA: hypothetical protein VI612_02550 [Candidatus Nanoarchaeia archaeon]|nr:hypothetical protein [Candidatus Nanoarchaeia archaeon]
MSLDLPGFEAGFFDGKGHSRAIVEGGAQDHWLGYIIGTGIFEITPNITTIETGPYTLDLVAKVRGASFEFPSTHPEGERAINLERLHDGIPRPRTLITEDGRIFHDASLLRSQIAPANREILARFLAFLSEDHRNFEEAYRQYLGEVTHV